MVRLTDEALRDPALHFGRHEAAAKMSPSPTQPQAPAPSFSACCAKSPRRSPMIRARAQLAPRLGGCRASVDRVRIAVRPLRCGAVAADGGNAGADGSSAATGTGAGGNLSQPRLYVTDTLGDPFAAQTGFSTMLAPIGNSRKEANAIKRDEPITVVIGNPRPPRRFGGKGPWRLGLRREVPGCMSPMRHWDLPPRWGQGAHAKHLKNLYVFFWRWATSWKVFAPDLFETTGRRLMTGGGIVTYITVSGFLNGPGFEKMRMELRRDCSDIWVIDCTPEGHQPEVPTSDFSRGVQHPVCIVVAARKKGKIELCLHGCMCSRLDDGPSRRETGFSVELSPFTLSGPTG